MVCCGLPGLMTAKVHSYQYVFDSRADVSACDILMAQVKQQVIALHECILGPGFVIFAVLAICAVFAILYSAKHSRTLS